jgi:hypothetical protein
VSGSVVSLPIFFQWFIDDFAAPGSSADAAMLLWVSRFCDARVAGQLRRISELSSSTFEYCTNRSILLLNEIQTWRVLATQNQH